jgi:hypothetical protein
MAGEKLVRRALEAVRKPAAAPREGIRAYHSSPHDFDRFDLSKIGTGEGAQAYGHGLYFAESPKVSGQGGDYWRQFWNKMPSGPERSAATALFANKFDRDKAIDHLLRDIEYNSARGVPGKYGNGPDIEEGHRLLAQEGQQALDILRSGQIAGPRTYEVNIRANPEQFLDWDKPLREQPEVVQNFFQARVNPSKGRAYNDDEFRSAFGNPLSGTPYEGAASSRGFLEPILSGGQESADFVNLVAKSNPEAASSLQAAIDKYARFNSPTGADVYQAIAHSNRSTIGFVPSFDRGVSASQELLEAGIPGIRYLDRGSRGAGEGSRNYVVFDDRLVDIMRKYGLPMMTAGAGAASMADQPGVAMEAGDMARDGYAGGGVIRRAIEAARKAVAPEDLLMGIHNTAEGRKLDMIERLGGLPAPSIAITKPSQGYTSFGDISLVAPVEMVTPGRKTPVFGSDVYSPRFPDVEDDQIFRGFTPAGRRRYAPLTMENVLREMKGNIRGGESFNYGPASIRAQVTPQFGSLPEMQAARDKIIPASEFGAQKDMSAEMMERLRERFEPYFKPTDSYRRSWSAFPEVLTDYARTGRPSEFAYDYKDLPAEALTDARSFLSHLRDMPTEYFEAKPQRGVPLSEFAGAVVPADVPGSVVDRIRNMGINRIEEYGDDASRAAALMKFVGEQGFADGGGVKGGRLLEDEYPTQYLPNVGRQVMADGGSPAAEKYEAMPGFFSRMLGLSGGSQPEADIQQYENRMRAIAQQPEDIRSMTHAPSKPMRPIEIEGGFIGKRQLGEAPYDVAGPLSGMAQAAYSLKTVPFYFTPAAPLAAASDFGEAVIDTKSALDKGDYLGAGVTGALGVAAPAVAYRRQAGDAVRSGLEAARRFVARNPGTATAVGAGAATLAPEDAEASGSGLIRRGLDAVRGVRAYHGSPHSFDRFDLSKIGTGEGAQAYGHGLYFAEAEPVARGYRDKLTSGTYKTSAGEIFDPFTLEHLNIKVPAYKSIDNAIERGFELLQTQPERRDLITRDLNRLMAARDAGAVPNPGSMYEVNIRANPEQFLDWDKPAAEQPMLNRLPMITDLRRDIGPQEFNRMSFGGAYETLGNAGELEEAARKAGIPGIKYLDQGSRGAGEGSRNYVVFDDKLIDILRKYGIPLMAAGTGASALQDVSSPREKTVP